MIRYSLRLLSTLRTNYAVPFPRLVSKMQPRIVSGALHTSPSHREDDRSAQQSKSKSLILQNPFRWLSVFFDFLELKNRWDPDFNRKEFIEGTKQAISTVLSLIATERLDDLTGLIKREAVNKFVQQASEMLGYGNTQHLKDVDDIIAMPYRVKLQSIVDQNYCDIDVHFLVVKNMDSGQSSPSSGRALVCLLFAKFHRNYSPGQLPDWTITDLSLQKTTPL
uniref:Putative juvenile hormone esterase binding protein n=1 Tax=Ixodes ricinus TaxID=34613 RepID=A0A131Y722_IXORI